MDVDSPVVGRFFKVLVPGFETRLKLPPAVTKKLNKVDLKSKKALLKSCKGSWEVDVTKCDDGLLHFYGESWVGYVSEHELKLGEFIVFEHTGRLHFDTLVFDETNCLKGFTDDDVECLEHVEPVDGKEKAASSGSNQNPKIQFKITKWTLQGYVNLPVAFSRSNGMRKNGSVMLRNATGGSWLAKLVIYHAKEGDKARITSLTKFVRENKLERGDTCIFEVVESSESPKHVVMDVVIMRRRSLTIS